MKLTTKDNIDRVVNAFIYTAEFAQFDFDELPDNYEIDQASRDKITADCYRFLQLCEDTLSPSEIEMINLNIDTETSSAGGDFFYTRNGYGVGFWDRPEIYGDLLSKKLTTISEIFSEVHVFLEGNVIYFE